jgi:hypothetical protein
VVADAEAGAPIGPGADEEAAFLATQRAVEGPPSAPAEGEEPAAAQKLPPLDGLVGRIPPEVLAALDDLFRAKFTAVRRVPASVLK